MLDEVAERLNQHGIEVRWISELGPGTYWPCTVSASSRSAEDVAADVRTWVRSQRPRGKVTIQGIERKLASYWCEHLGPHQYQSQISESTEAVYCSLGREKHTHVLLFRLK